LEKSEAWVSAVKFALTLFVITKDKFYGWITGNPGYSNISVLASRKYIFCNNGSFLGPTLFGMVT
jgi:hypothetical protein